MRLRQGWGMNWLKWEGTVHHKLNSLQLKTYNLQLLFNILINIKDCVLRDDRKYFTDIRH